MTWPGDGTKLLSSDGSQVIVGSGLDLSAGQLDATGPTWPGSSTEVVASDGSAITVGDGLNLSAGTISSTDIKCTYSPTVGDSKVSLLLHMEGANNSTTFTDKSYSPKTVIVNGNAKISTASSKFGSSSAYFDGAGDFLSFVNSADFNLSGGVDYTIEGWINLSSMPVSGIAIISKHENLVGWDWAFYLANTTTVSFYSAEVVTQRTIPTVSFGTWYHFAVVRSSGNVSIYWDGVKRGASFASATTNSNAALAIGIDRLGNTLYPYHGYIDEIRVSKGIARYTSDFTPSASAFANADGSAELVASNVGDVIYSGDGVFVCTSLSPLTWKKFSVASTINP